MVNEWLTAVPPGGRHRRKLFEPGDPTTRLVLQNSLRTSKGNIVATYGKL